MFKITIEKIAKGNRKSATLLLHQLRDNSLNEKQELDFATAVSKIENKTSAHYYLLQGLLDYYLPPKDTNAISASSAISKMTEKLVPLCYSNDYPNDISALLWRAWMYEEGLGEPNDKPNPNFAQCYYTQKIIPLLDNEIKKNDSKAMVLRAWMHQNGKGGKIDFKAAKAAIELYEKAIGLNNADAMFYRALMHEKGNDCDVNDQAAFALYEKAHALKHDDATYNLALMYYKGNGVKINYQKAIQLLENGIKQGEPDAMFLRGVMYKQGKGDPVNIEKACSLFHRSFVAGDRSQALNNLTTFYSKNNLYAAIHLCFIYLLGEGDVKADKQRAKQYLKQAFAWLGKTMPRGNTILDIAIETYSIIPIDDDGRQTLANFLNEDIKPIQDTVLGTKLNQLRGKQLTASAPNLIVSIGSYSQYPPLTSGGVASSSSSTAVPYNLQQRLPPATVANTTSSYPHIPAAVPPINSTSTYTDDPPQSLGPNNPTLSQNPGSAHGALFGSIHNQAATQANLYMQPQDDSSRIQDYRCIIDSQDKRPKDQTPR